MKYLLLLGILLLLARIFFYSFGNESAFERVPKEKVNIPVISDAKEKIIANMAATLPADDSALLAGIVFGERAEFDPNYFNALRRTGVLHVIAASGMNVAMVAGFIFPALVLVLRRGHAIIAASFVIILYTALANFEESIVRASIMAIFAYGAAVLGRQNTSVAALLFAAFIMVMFDPKIISAVGFQLSFAATAGIILFEPVFRKLGDNIFLEDARTTTSAQIATVPILLFYFETYSPISFLANLLILWTVPPLMILGLISSLLSLIAPILAVPFLWLAAPLLMYFKSTILFLNNFAPEFDVKNLPIVLVWGYYTLILALILALWKRLAIRL